MQKAIFIAALISAVLLSATTGFSQLPNFTIDNKKDACNALPNGSFDINLISSTGSTTAIIFSVGPSIGPIVLSPGLNPITGLIGTVGGRAYLVVVSDDNGFSNNTTTIFLISNVSASITLTTNVSSCSSPDGAIDILVSGGTGTYAYVWSGPGGFVDPGTEDLLSIQGGSYTVTVSDAGTNCFQTLGPIVITIPTPTITLGVNPTVCGGVTSANLTYSATTNSPDQYSIDFNLAANTAGFMDIVNAVLTASPIVITVPGAAPAAVYSGNLTVLNSTSGCVSTVSAVTVTVVANPTITLGASPSVC
ncbi:MAG: hypothetical protein AABY93_02985, partial [Bacteroidota bacterium]